ncbi:golgin subfamily A member 6-like protein 22 [Culicoides brevitarsis]|uniref:golgin subfamily A member 6-like protein 22 n=1 Tax=Culicoides brevitarsis TaxID=469753 RepID=UPI00307C5F94
MFQVFCESDPLKTFLDKLGESQADFEWIQHAVRGIRDGHVTKRDILTYEDDSDSVEDEEEDEKLTSFIETGDQWYEKFRENECRASKKKEYCHEKEAREQKLWEAVHLDKAFEPKKFPKPIIPMKFDENEEDEYDLESFHQRHNDDLRTLRRNTLIEGVKTEKTSKNEQEMAANATNYEDSEEILEEKRRSINPSNEIKLKISNKLMHRGMGPSLPSYGYSDGQVLVYREPEKDPKSSLKEEKPDDTFVFPYKERDLPNYNLFKRAQDDEKTENWSESDYPEYENDPKDEETKFGRHLLSVSDKNEDHRHHHKHQKGHKLSKKLEKEFDYDKEAKELHVFGPKVASNMKCEAKHDNEKNEFQHKSEKISLKEPIFDDLQKNIDKNDTNIDSTSPFVNIKVDFNSNSSILPKNSTFAKIEIALSKSRRSLKPENDQFSIKNAMKHLIENVHKSLDDDPELKNWISPHLMSRYDALHADDESSKGDKNEKFNDFRDKNVKELSSKIERLIEKELITKNL